MNKDDKTLLTLVHALNEKGYKGYELISKSIYLLIVAEKSNPNADSESLKAIVLEQLEKYKDMSANAMIESIENSENMVKTA